MVMLSHHNRVLFRWFSSEWNVEQTFLTKARNFPGPFFPMDYAATGRIVIIDLSTTRGPSQEPEADLLVPAARAAAQEDRPAAGSTHVHQIFYRRDCCRFARAASKDFYSESWEIHKCEPGYFNS
jgi:hypothetical protein